MEFTRRSALGAAGVAIAGTAGCTDTVLGVISGESFDEVTISIESSGTWRGFVEFDDGNTTNTVPRFNGMLDAELVIPDDLRSGDDVDSVEPPITVRIRPRDEATTEETPLTLTVDGDGEELGTATATTQDDSATVEYDP